MASSQLLAVHGLLSSQTLALPLLQTALPSDRAHWSPTLQTSLSSHFLALPLQVPAPQVSLSLQALPSLHPALLVTVTQPARPHLSSVQMLPSSQDFGVPLQEPALQPSSKVHASLSSQIASLLHGHSALPGHPGGVAPSGRSSASMTHTVAESDATGRQRVASVYSDKEMANWQLVELEKALQEVCDKHHVKAEVAKSTSDHRADREARKQLAAEVDVWLEKRKKSYNKGIDENELSLLRDVLYQHENEKAFLNTHEDGAFDDNDIRNPDNPYFGWSKGEIYNYCREHDILTQYSNFESIDFEAFIESLVLAHCKGNPKQREQVHRTLVRRSKSPKKRNAKLAQKALARLIV